MTAPEDDDPVTATHGDREAPGGPYFGRLLLVLLLAVAVCAFMTWWLGSTIPN